MATTGQMMSERLGDKHGGAESPVPADSPLMVAWEAYKKSEAYANSLKWALLQERGEDVVGALWSAFSIGFLHTHHNASPIVAPRSSTRSKYRPEEKVTCVHGMAGYCETCSLKDPGEFGEVPPKLVTSTPSAIVPCTEPDRARCPRLCQDFCNEAETRRANAREPHDDDPSPYDLSDSRHPANRRNR